jgi:hypothetical protein
MWQADTIFNCEIWHPYKVTLKKLSCSYVTFVTLTDKNLSSNFEVFKLLNDNGDSFINNKTYSEFLLQSITKQVNVILLSSHVVLVNTSFIHSKFCLIPSSHLSCQRDTMKPSIFNCFLSNRGWRTGAESHCLNVSSESHVTTKWNKEWCWCCQKL